VVKKPRRKWITSRDITLEAIEAVINHRPYDPIPYLMEATGASEKQCHIAMNRAVRKRRIIYDKETTGFSMP
jgi:hypothetical protein